jgi:hypothetical protein
MYNITFKNQAIDPINKAPIVVPVGAVNSTSISLALTGKGAANYGTLLQTNLVRLLENFADNVEPNTPTIGQLWYDSLAGTIKVCANTTPSVWKSLGGIQVTDISNPAPSTPSLGDFWFERTNSTTGILYVYTGIGRYPSTPTTIGGWDQVWPEVQTFAGREEYDLVRSLVDNLIGSGISNFGSGALHRNVNYLTDFVSLDKDLRTKYQSLLSTDLYSPNTGISIDREITNQAPSTTLSYYLDSSSPSDGFISASTNNPSLSLSSGFIFVNGVSTPILSGILQHSIQADDAYIMWDVSATINGVIRFFVVRQLDDMTWVYDNNAGVNIGFVPTSMMYIIGTISTYAGEFDVPIDTVFPIDKKATIWGHAVPLLGTKYEHLKVEPNSHDWDSLLSAAKYALNRLELPSGFLKSISDLPFVVDGRKIATNLQGLNSLTDVRYPSANRRINKKASIVSMVQSFTETLNALNVGIQNKFSLKGINGSTGIYPTFPSNIVTTTYCAPPVPGLSNIVSSGIGDCRVQFRFASMDDMNRFMGAGSAIQIEVDHTGGATSGDTNFRALLLTAGRQRLTGDKIRIFGQSLPLTITQSISTSGLWNANSAGKILSSITLGPSTISVLAYRVSNVQFDILVSFVAGSTLAGNTSLTLKIIADNETFLPGPTPVYAMPLAFNNSDVVNSF